MRLTLRTLLAYLDDTLEPAEARQMGQKVAESPPAQELVTRIRDLARRRVGSAPEGGARFDPNVAAEYLDNVLPPEKVTEVEEACLAEDAYLSEVAACHQILTLVLGEPVQVPPLAKERMYELVRDPHQGGRRAARAGAVETAANAGHDEADDMLLMGLPRQLGQGPWRRRLVPAAVILLLLAVLAGAVWFSLASLLGNNASTQTRQPIPGTGPGPVVLNDQKEKQPPEGQKPDAKKPEDVKKPDETKVEIKKPDDGKPRDTKPDDTKQEPVRKPDERPTKRPPSSERRPAGEFVSADRILLRRGEDKQWQRVRRGSTVSTNDYLVSLPGYRSELRLETPVRLGLWGSLPDDPRARAVVLESAVVLHADPSVDLDFTLERGRVLISSHKDKGPVRVRVRFHGDEVWELALQTSETEVALELWGADPLDLGLGKDPRGEGPMAVLGLFVLKGELGLHVEHEEYTMPAPSRYVWDSVHGPSHRVEALQQLPEWAKRFGSQPLQPRAQQALDNLSRSLSGKDVDVALASTLEAPDQASRIVAVFCLGAVDDLSGVLNALSDTKYPEVRGTASFVLKYILNLKADNQAQLKLAMDRKGFSAEQAEIVVQLLRPFPVTDINQPATYEALIAYLSNDKLAIRELAYDKLEMLAPVEAKEVPFDPAWDNDRREKAAREWKRRIPDGKLPARPTAPAPKK
jgi:hypothetical protein